MHDRDIDLSVNAVDHSSCLPDDFFTSDPVHKQASKDEREQAALEAEALTGLKDVTGKERFVANTTIRPTMTSAKPKDVDGPMRRAFVEFKRLCAVKNVRTAVRFLQASRDGKATIKKYGKQIRKLLGFYGNLYIDAKDFKCEHLHKDMPRGKKLSYVLESGKCRSCISKIGSVCGKFDAKLINDFKGIKLSREDAVFLVRNMTRDKDILSIVDESPYYALKLAYILEA